MDEKGDRMDFEKIEDEVREILKVNMQARADDMKLYADYVFTKLNKMGYSKVGWLEKVFSDTRFRLIHGIAPDESVSRIRRKLQNEDIALQPDLITVKARKELIKEYKAYARKGREV